MSKADGFLLSKEPLPKYWLERQNTLFNKLESMSDGICDYLNCCNFEQKTRFLTGNPSMCPILEILGLYDVSERELEDMSIVGMKRNFSEIPFCVAEKILEHMEHK